jgi:3,4-dihydroxy 2-butanone 4-phosphate synthase/GTP cyclohydrolase II
MTTVVSDAPLPTKHGEMRCLVIEDADGIEHVALISGDVAREEVLVRVHSECLTGEAFGSLKCDCGAQLDDALARIAEEGGVVVYLRGHEGRGIGLANKVRAYALQARGADTVDANRALGLPDDARRYDAAASILHDLGVRSVVLLTNNPEKVAALRALGVDVRARVASIVPVTAHNAAYLATKRERMNHLLPTAIGSK